MRDERQKKIIFLWLGIFLATVLFSPFFHVLAEDIDVTATVPSICGNGAVEAGENCDDNNTNNGDGCSSVCANEGGGGNGGGGGNPPANPPPPAAQCGNGAVEAGEECDDGNGINNDFCTNACSVPVCGDGNVQGAEQCDDGNNQNGDGCSIACIVEAGPVCGNGAVEAGEQCDDGNQENWDGCSALCISEPQPICGNNIREKDEMCDDGNVLNGDLCSDQCLVVPLPICANREVEFGENCDDGNLINGDGCSNQCQREPDPICGNGRQERNEVCDDGNLINGDGCNNRCQFVPIPGTFCGNGIKEAGEECDDGNKAAGDGCTAACQLELAGQGPVVDPVAPDVPLVIDPIVPVEEFVPPERIEEPIPAEDVPLGEQIQEEVSQIKPPEFEGNVPILSGVSKQQPVVKNITAVAQNLGKNIVSSAKFVAEEVKYIAEIFDTVADNPEVEETTKTVVAPATAAVVVASVAPSLASVVLPLLRFVFLQPLLLFGRKKRETWGQVYNSFTKLPVDLAMVRLLDTKTKRILQSRVTDTQGRYFFIAEPGDYLLEVTKPGFTFPSVLLQGIKTDGKLVDIYHGEQVQVTGSGIGITPNIPLDPAGVASKTPKRIVWEKRWKVIQHIISLLGIALTLVSLYVAPVWYMWVFLGIHILAYIGFNRFVKPKKPNGWGLVYEKNSTAPVGSTVVRLFTKQYNKLVSTQVTDKKGRYAFLVGPSEYYVTYEKKGYKPLTSGSVEIQEGDKNSVIKEKVALEKEERK